MTECRDRDSSRLGREGNDRGGRVTQGSWAGGPSKPFGRTGVCRTLENSPLERNGVNYLKSSTYTRGPSNPRHLSPLSSSVPVSSSPVLPRSWTRRPRLKGLVLTRSYKHPCSLVTPSTSGPQNDSVPSFRTGRREESPGRHGRCVWDLYTRTPRTGLSPSLPGRIQDSTDDQDGPD